MPVTSGVQTAAKGEPADRPTHDGRMPVAIRQGERPAAASLRRGGRRDARRPPDGLEPPSRSAAAALPPGCTAKSVGGLEQARGGARSSNTEYSSLPGLEKTRESLVSESASC